MTDRLDELLFSIGEEENGRVDFDQMYAELLKKQSEEEAKRSKRRARFVRYGAMAACAVALIGIGAAAISDSMKKPETLMMSAMEEEAAEEAPQSVEAAPADEAPMEEAGTAAEGPMVAAAAPDTEAAEAPKAVPEERTADNAKSQATAAAVQETAEIGTCADAKSRLKAAGIEAEPYEGDDAPQEGYALMMGGGEAIWNAGSGVYKVTLNGDIAARLKKLCE